MGKLPPGGSSAHSRPHQESCVPHLPAFFLFVCWSFLSDVGLFFLQSASTATYFKLYEIQLVIDASMIFAFWWSWPGPFCAPFDPPCQERLDRHCSSCCIHRIDSLAPGGLTLPTSKLAPRPGLLPPAADIRHPPGGCLHRHGSIKPISFYRLAQRELQVATGLGLYSMVSLTVGILHTYQVSGTQQYHLLDQAVTASYLVALVIGSFPLHQRGRTPRIYSQMQTFLLAVAGSARAARMTLADTPPRIAGSR